MDPITSFRKNRHGSIGSGASFLTASSRIKIPQLTDALNQQYEKASVQEIKLPDGQKMPQLAQPITLGDGAKGFAYVAGFGPGGSAYGATVTSPDGKFDVSITLAFSSAIGSKKIQKLQAYYDALAKKGEGGMLGLLQAILTKAYPSIQPAQAHLGNRWLRGCAT